jgi:hypothetical protein
MVSEKRSCYNEDNANILKTEEFLPLILTANLTSKDELAMRSVEKFGDALGATYTTKRHKPSQTKRLASIPRAFSVPKAARALPCFLLDSFRGARFLCLFNQLSCLCTDLCCCSAFPQLETVMHERLDLSFGGDIVWTFKN